MDCRGAENMTVWRILSWIANCQLAGNDANIIGLLWAVALSFVGYNHLRKFHSSSFGVNSKKSYFWLIPFLFSITLVVYIQDIVDITIITPIALAFGRWVEMPNYVQPLSIYNFLCVYWNVLLTIGLFTYFYLKQNFLKFLHFTRESLALVFGIAIFYIAITNYFGVWNYNLLVDPLRTVYFWILYPEIRILWGLLYLSILKKPTSFITVEKNAKK